MDPSYSLHGLTIPLQILLVDLMLGADNALMIGLACRALPPLERKRATALGAGGAMLLRLLMTTVAMRLLALPLVKFASALVLMIIALNLANADAGGAETSESANSGPSRLWSAIAIIIVADATMSLDNVVALAAIAQGSYLWLLIGVGLSLPILAYGGLFIAQWLSKAPGLLAFGTALLGWIAGSMAVSDALWANWADANAPGLTALAPLLGAAFVYLHGLLVPRPIAAPRAPARRRAAPLARPPASLSRASAAASPEPIDEAALASPRPRPNVAPVKAEDRVILVGMLLLAVLAGGFLVFIFSYSGFE